MLRLKSLLLVILCCFATAFTLMPSLTKYTFPKLLLFPTMPENEDNSTTVEGAALGRYLFYDTILSLNYDMSCGSCHKQEAAFSDAPHKRSIGRNGTLTSRNTMPLFNLAWYPVYFWDGRAGSLEEQVFHLVRDKNEMNLAWSVATARLNNSKFYKQQFSKVFGVATIDSTMVSKAMAQFLRTLISYQSKFDSVIIGTKYLSKDEYDGMVLMNDMTKGDCLHCHLTDGHALTTQLGFSNTGLDRVEQASDYKDKGYGGVTGKLSDYGKFRTPSLRNVALTAPYMHDGRFETLEQVLDFYSEGVHNTINIDSKMGHARKGGVHLTPEEKKKIIAFLHTLTDNEFVNNPKYSNPFRKKK
jgi:cytochrome c peroxidase